MSKKEKSKVLVFARSEGNIEAILELKKIIEKENIEKVISLGNAIGLHSNINSCIKLLKDFVLIKGNFEKTLIDQSDIFGYTKLTSKKMILKSIEEIGMEEKEIVASLPEIFETNEAIFSFEKHAIKANKLNFFYPWSNVPIIEYEKQEKLLFNTTYPIKDFIGKEILIGYLSVFPSQPDSGFYCVFDNDSITFNQFEYSYFENSNMIEFLTMHGDPQSAKERIVEFIKLNELKRGRELTQHAESNILKLLNEKKKKESFFDWFRTNKKK